MQGVVMKRKMFVTLLMYFAFASALFAISDKGKKANGSWFPPECECSDVESFDVACSGTDCPPGEICRLPQAAQVVLEAAWNASTMRDQDCAVTHSSLKPRNR